MYSWRAPLSWLSILTLGAASNCSVFPDQAHLPAASSAAGIAGEASSSQAGLGGAGSDNPMPIAGAGAAGASEGGAGGSLGVEGGSPNMVGAAGAVDAPGGAGGDPAACQDPQQQVVAVTVDTWIESTKPTTGHGSDKTLSIVGGVQERRALVQLTLPVVVPGAVLLNATLALHLQANADVGLRQRQLRVHRLEHDITESRTTWDNWGQGNRAWTLPGGDFGPLLAEAAIPAGISDGALTFNVTAAVRAAFSEQAVALGLIILESSAPPAAPADLAFASREGDALGIPALMIQYCPP